MALDPDHLEAFYEAGYRGTGDPRDADRGARWRQLGAVVKTDHIIQLLAGRPAPDTVLEVGCGDGSVLDELARRGIGDRRVGIEISAAAVEIAAHRSGVSEAHRFDGDTIDEPDGSYDLAVCTHVLEHVVAPAILVREMTRVARAVIVEVPLERNVMARRASARALSLSAGHLQRFDRDRVRQLIADSGWRVEHELLDPLPPSVHTFDARASRAVAKGYAKWAARRTLATVPPVAERLMTLHYALLATPDGAI